MKPPPAPKKPTIPLILTPRHEQILKTIHAYRYVTVQDIKNLLFSKGSLTYARSLLSALAGGKDHAERHYLYRFPFPTGSAGNRERVFTLGALGRDFLANELGMPVEWYFRPSKAERLSHSHVLHHLLVTRFVVAAQAYTRNHPHLHLLQTRLGHELASHQARVAGEKKEPTAKPAIIPMRGCCLRHRRGVHIIPCWWKLTGAPSFAPNSRRKFRRVWHLSAAATTQTCLTHRRWSLPTSRADRWQRTGRPD